MEARLRSDIQVAGLGRHAETLGLIYTVIHKGHAEGGMIFVKWLDGRDVTLLTETQKNGTRGWRLMTAAPLPEGEANQRLEQERSFDPDLWVMEIVGAAKHIATVFSPILSDQG
ncbi:MAG: DUF1491 family protein [Pseudomonadota bacterium]